MIWSNMIKYDRMQINNLDSLCVALPFKQKLIVGVCWLPNCCLIQLSEVSGCAFLMQLVHAVFQQEWSLWSLRKSYGMQSQPQCTDIRGLKAFCDASWSPTRHLTENRSISLRLNLLWVRWARLTCRQLWRWQLFCCKVIWEISGRLVPMLLSLPRFAEQPYTMH